MGEGTDIRFFFFLINTFNVPFISSFLHFLSPFPLFLQLLENSFKNPLFLS